jgi:hypothetical protein
MVQCEREGWSDKMKQQADEGCNLKGFLTVNKVPGNFHIAPGKSFQQHHVHVHDLQSFGREGMGKVRGGGTTREKTKTRTPSSSMLTAHPSPSSPSTQFNLTHYVRKLSFGEEYPGQVNPLDGHDEAAMKSGFSRHRASYYDHFRAASHLCPALSSDGLIMYQYFVKVVPTRYQRVGQPEVSRGGTASFSFRNTGATMSHRMFPS